MSPGKQRLWQGALLLVEQKEHLWRAPFIHTECGEGLRTKRCFRIRQRNHTKQKGPSNSILQIKEELDFGFRSEESVLESMAHEGDVAQGCRNPLNPKSPL